MKLKIWSEESPDLWAEKMAALQARFWDEHRIRFEYEVTYDEQSHCIIIYLPQVTMKRGLQGRMMQMMIRTWLRQNDVNTRIVFE